jgi:amino acid adenylation domain-containing protein
MNMTVIDYLINSAQAYPDKVAFSDQDKAMTYSEVLLNTQKIATALIRKLSVVREPVAVLIDRNVESVCTFMGIAMSRNFYVPIDMTQPLQRIQTILTQMQPAAIVSIGNIQDEVRDFVTVPVLEYADLIETDVDTALIESVRKECLDTDPLYAMCTSGSTGVPKGVLICHRSVLDFIPVFCETFGFDSNEVFGNQAPFDFDVSVKDIYSTLYCGASMFIIPKVCFAMPKLLVDALDDRKITTIIWAVSALCIAAGVNAFKKKVPQYLKKILFSGEVMPIKMLNVWRKYYPDALFVNLYGPTEITCNCLYYIIDREFENTEKLPLGIPFKNEGVLYLNDQNQPIKVGECGEICVIGTCLALGYYRNPEKTAAAFVQNPLNDRYPERMYRTGDLAELKENGEYYFAARKDFQIKHMGHRIELEEIEMFMNAVDGVTRASCLFDHEKNKIVAYYVGEIEKMAILESLKLNLPKYMIPNIITQVESLPINKNGKIDRQKLRQFYENGGIGNAAD